MTKKIWEHKGLILVVAVAVYLAGGLLYSWSKFAVYMCEEMGISKATATIPYTVSMVCFSGGALLDGFISRFLSIKKAYTFAALVMALGYILSSFVTKSTFMLMCFTYGVMVSISWGIIFNCWNVYIFSLFSEKRGTASGMVQMGIGLSGVTITPAMLFIAAHVGWRKAYLFIGILLLVVNAFGWFFMREELMEDGSAKTKQAHPAAEETGRQYTPLQMLKCPSYWLMTIWKTMIIGVGQALMGQLAFVIQDYGNVSIQATAVSVFAFFCGASRFFWGSLSDKIGVIKSFYLSTAISIVSTLGLIVSWKTSNLTICIISMFAIGACYGSSIALPGLYTRNRYGSKHYRRLSGIGGALNIPVNFVAPTLISIMRTNSGSYYSYFILAAILAVVGALCITAVPMLDRNQDIQEGLITA